MRTLKYLIPALLFGLLVFFLLRGLSRDPREIPSPLIGKPAPAFSLPRLVAPTESWQPQGMAGRVWLLNVFASWCVPCLVEHPELLALQKKGALPIVGFNYKDDPAAATAWLAKHGNPYDEVIADRSGAAALDYGVYGVPESFLIDRQGVIRFKHVGPLTPEVIQNKLLPMLETLSK